MGRPLALVLALTVAASGSGLPTCVTLLAPASQRCPMHRHERGGGAQLKVGDEAGDGCHSDADVGCATGGTCPASGTAAPLATQTVLPAPALGRDAASTTDPAPHSFFSAPLPPPPLV